MSRHTPPITIATLALLLAACGGAGANPRQCRSNGDCAPDAHCSAEGACVSSSPTVTAISSREGQSDWTGYRLDFKASASLDPQSGEHVREYRWSIAGELRDRCMDPEVLAEGESYSVVIWCPGEWDVKLVVVDSRGVAATEATHHLTLRDPPTGTAAFGPGVTPRDPPVLRVAERVDVDHRCAPDPSKPSGWTCTLDGPGGSREVALVAEAHDASGAPVRVTWTCVAPEALRSTAHARLVAATQPTARLAVETDDPRIAGEYRCVVQIWDARGQTRSAVQVVRVGNRAPVLSAAPGPLRVPHRNEGAAYRATVVPPAMTIADPDGDPLSAAAFELRTARDGGTPSSASSLEITVPHGDPAALIGAGVRRTLFAHASDSNGATGELSWPVEITNDRPQRRTFDAAPRLPHRWDGTAYVALADVASYVDPEGDPVTFQVDRSDTVCGAALVGTTVRVDCRQLRDGSAAIRKIVGTHVLRIAVRDAWTPAVDGTGAPLLDEVRAEVLNGRPATFTVAPLVFATPSGPKTCCNWVYNHLSYDMTCSAWSVNLPADARDVAAYGVGIDPDGDPVTIAVQTSGSAQVSVGGGAPGTFAQLEMTTFVPPVRVSLPAASGCGTALPSGSATVTFDDGTGPTTLAPFTIQP